ncbi:uncharacterized protein isoform X2 [Leptinotarsa decemlineata]|uniref:uncharacterized protein isoform X2 n=1 Tax=Leptinotarsa decemlineata TaxID=7539 RepID=UPI000C25399B|nr:coiled-coil domain-containing protein 18-like isoform X2 [Leptinotarsa decemlineata]
MSKGYKIIQNNKRYQGFDEQHNMNEHINGVMCAIHSAANFDRNFPCPQHQSLQICATPNNYGLENKRTISAKGRTRSKSPIKGATKKKSVSFPCQQWSTTLKTSTNHICKDTGDAPYPVNIESIGLNVEKVNSCPDRTCSHISNQPIKGCSIKSLSTMEVSNSPIYSQDAKQNFCPESVVIGLKDEIEKVKSQLEQISTSNSDKFKVGGKGEPEKQISQLKAENKQLKKELEQKKKMYLASVRDVERAKDILGDYEKKVILLHEQAIQSSKVMKQSKDKFCKCINQKENVIKELKKNNETFLRTIEEKENKYNELSKALENMQGLFQENNEQYSTLSDSNKYFAEAIKVLEKQLNNSLTETEQYREEVKKLEQQIADFECKTCSEMEAKSRKQKEKYTNRIKEQEGKEKILKEKITELSSQMEVVNAQKSSFEQLQNQCNELQAKILEYEKYAIKYATLEKKYQQQCELAVENERNYETEREELKNLVEELTNVVKQNKMTLLQLSDINKHQEALIASQSAILLEKMAESEIEMLRNRSMELENEIDDLRKSLEEPCSKETCISLAEELEELKVALSREKDNELVQEKIIQDQSQTIANLHSQIKEKISELSRAREESNIAEEEINKINDVLIKKHKELEKEMSEKDHLLQKLRKLESQKTALTREMMELEKVLDRYCEEKSGDESQQMAIAKLQKEVAEQSREWELQKAILADEKEKAVKAAKFATQKLIDTVADFQKQVDAQKKVQLMLTKMLHDKEEELQIIHWKISSINSLTNKTEEDFPLNEIYRRSRSLDISNLATNSSFYSSCSNCCPKHKPCGSNCPRKDLHELFEMITRTEEPIKDI